MWRSALRHRGEAAAALDGVLLPLRERGCYNAIFNRGAASLEWIAWLAAFALIVWLMVKYKTFRYVALGIVALIGVGGWAWYEKNQSDERRASALIKPTAHTANVDGISPAP